MDASSGKLRSLLVGDFSRLEFSAAREQLLRLTEAECLNRLQDLQDSRRAPSKRLRADLVVLAQARPGQFDPRRLGKLKGRMPLARFIMLLGSLCEGETRTGSPWPGAVRIFWYEWEAQLLRLLGAHRRGDIASLWLPETASDEERLLLETSVSKRPRPSGLIEIVTRSTSLGGALAEALFAAGYATVQARPGEQISSRGARAVLWEGVQLDEPERVQLTELRRRRPAVPIIALVDFPRIETRERALAAGANRILPKPPRLDDLLWHLERLMAAPQSSDDKLGNAA